MDAPDLTNAPEAREATELAQRAADAVRDYKITTPVQFEDGAQYLKKIKAGQKRLEELRTAITKPLNAALKAANDLFRQPAAVLDEAERSVKRELVRYQDEQERIRREEQRIADEKARKERERLEAQARKAAEAGKEAKVEQLQERAAAVVAPVIQREAPKVSGVSMRDTWLFEVVTPGLVPEAYKLVDESKIRKVVGALKGETDIPGVRVWCEKTVAAGAA